MDILEIPTQFKSYNKYDLTLGVTEGSGPYTLQYEGQEFAEGVIEPGQLGVEVSGFQPSANNGILTLQTQGTQGTIAAVRNMVNPYKILDGKPKVVAFKEGRDKWVTAYTYEPEWMQGGDNQLATFTGGELWDHHASTTYNSFYGVIHKSRIALLFNDVPSLIKIHQTLSVEGTLPDWVHMRSETPNIQSTDLYPVDFETREGVHYAAILMDRLSPNMTGTYEAKQYSGNGDPMRTPVYRILLEYAGGKDVRINFVNIGFVASQGHKV